MKIKKRHVAMARANYRINGWSFGFVNEFPLTHNILYPWWLAANHKGAKQ